MKEEFEEFVYIDNDMILEFLKVFSRAEYALKNVKEFSNFQAGESVKAEANWDKFANKIDEKFNLKMKNDSTLKNARKYLWENPPKKQMIDSCGTLIYETFNINDAQRKTQQLLLMVRGVRNNLFHGGKHTPIEGDGINQERNKCLIKYSIVVIKACIALDGKISGHYDK